MKNYKEFLNTNYKKHLENLNTDSISAGLEPEVGKYWKIPTDEIRYIASVLKIVNTEEIQQVHEYLTDSFFLDEVRKHDYVLFFKYKIVFKEYEDEDDYGYWFDMDVNQISFYEKRQHFQVYDYQGEIELDETDLENARLFIQTEKYNL